MFTVGAALIVLSVCVTVTSAIQCSCFKQFVGTEPPLFMVKMFIPVDLNMDTLCPNGVCQTTDKCARAALTFSGYSGTIGVCNATDSIVQQIISYTGTPNLGACSSSNAGQQGICTCTTDNCNPKATDLTFLPAGTGSSLGGLLSGSGSGSGTGGGAIPGLPQKSSGNYLKPITYGLLTLASLLCLRQIGQLH